MRGLLSVQVELLEAIDRGDWDYRRRVARRICELGLGGQMYRRGLIKGGPHFAAPTDSLTADGRMLLALYREGALP